MERYIGAEIKNLANLIKRCIQQEQCHTCDDERLSGVQMFVIGYLGENEKKGDVFQRDLEAQFAIRRSTVTGILNTMEKNGLIVREAVASDARMKKLFLTPKAHGIYHQVKQGIGAMERTLRSGFTQGELEIFFSLLDRVRANVEQREKTEPGE